MWLYLCVINSIGRNVQHLVMRPDEKYCFRLHGDLVYYCSERLMRQSTNIGSEQLLSIGTVVGKFSKTKKFHLRITFLDYLAQYAKVRRLTLCDEVLIYSSAAHSCFG